MRYFLSIVLFLLVVLTCYAEDVYLHFRPPQAGKVVPVTLRSDLSFNFDQEKALGSKRNRALSEYVPLYTYSPDRSDAVKNQLEAFIAKIPDFKAQKRGGEAAFWGYMKREFGVDFQRSEVEQLFRYKNLENLLEVVMTIRESILQNKIIESRGQLEDKTKIEIYYPGSAITQAFSTDQLLTLEAAQSYLRKKAPQLLWHVNAKILDPVLEIFSQSILPNLVYDENENNRRIEEIVEKYPFSVIPYNAGDILVRSGKVLDEEAVALLDDYRDIRQKDINEKILWILFVIVMLIVFYNVMLSQVFLSGRQKELTQQYHLVLLISTFILLDVFLLFTPYPIYVLPFAILPLILIVLNQERASTLVTTLMGAGLISIYLGRTLEVFFFFTLGALGAIFWSFDVRKRAHILVPATVVGTINAASVMFSSIDWGNISALLFENSQHAGMVPFPEIFSSSLRINVGWAFIGGLIAGPLTLLFLPVFELIWNDVPNFKLNKYSDLQSPIMKDLLRRAPGTYQHTMMVASLAQAVGEAVGANTLLLRISAYYHDIGKIQNAELFAENQYRSSNNHDSMNPRESAQIIINHVENGTKLAEEIGLPQGVIDLIMQHHGTQLVEYFYSKAARGNPDSSPRKESYRYPGPKPRSIEAAILMIADAAEAASRSFKNLNRDKIENIVRVVIEKRIADGQFDDCDICLSDLGDIARSLTDALEAQFHSRVMYPWQEEKTIDF